MADYYAHFALAVPATQEQGEWLEALYETAIQIQERSGGGGGNPRGHRAAPRGMISLARKLLREFEPEDCMGLGVETEPGAVVVWSEDGCGNFFFAAELVQLFLRHFELDDVLMAQWALTCSSPRPDGFGGGAAVIDRERIITFDPSTLAAEAAQRERARLAAPT